MTRPLLIGVALTLLAGLLSGNCMLPMKFARTWKWENVWLVFSIVSLLVLPWSLTLMFVRHPFAVYAALTLRQFAVPVAFGFGWGIAQILFGISVMRLGLGIAYAVIVGLSALLGTLVPLFVQQRSLAKGPALLYILGGIAMMIVGIVLTAWGGQSRERTILGNRSAEFQQHYPGAIALAVLCGIMAPMLNYSFAFGQDIAQQAMRLGNVPTHAVYAVWPIGLAGGFLPNIVYSVWLLTRNRSWSLFRAPGPDILWPALMGMLWMSAFAIYGVSAAYLGNFGTSIGWGLFQIFMIMTATIAGALTSEWKMAPRFARFLWAGGLVSLAVATVLLAAGNCLGRHAGLLNYTRTFVQRDQPFLKRSL